MGRYPDFTPDDDEGLWLLKWIDGLRLAHRSSRSAAVGIVLERLPEGTHLPRVRVDDVAMLVGRRADSGPIRHAHALVGALPELAIGQVFQRGDCVGELPTTVHACRLRRGEEGHETMTLQASRRPPPGWSPEYPYRVLHAGEYALPSSTGPSQCLVVEAPLGVELVIPRSVIFKRFYAGHTRLANAITRGPFTRTCEDVLSLTPLASGLQTGIDPDTGTWQVILERSIADAFAPLLALLHFDAYARASSDAIYTDAVMDRAGQRFGTTPLKAHLPFDPEHGRVDLQLKGLWLRDRIRGATRLKRTFLATSIVDATFPIGLPPIAWERANSNRDGAVQEVNHVSSSYRPPAPVEGAADLQLDHAHDPTTARGQYRQLVDDFRWSRLPAIRKLDKARSTTYEGIGATRADTLGSIASVGFPHTGGNAPSALDLHTEHRPRCDRFEGLLRAMEQLIEARVLHRVDILAPLDRRQATDRGGRTAWLFLDHTARRTGRWPRSGWRLLSRDTTIQGRRAPRSALVLRVTKGSQSMVWIEIEGRTANDTYYSPVLAGLPDDAHAIVEHVLEVIAQNNGVNLLEVLPRVLRTRYGGRLAGYRHTINSADGVFDAASIQRLLNALCP